MSNEKVILVTGGASGIGRAVALKFAAAGAAVAILDMKMPSKDNVVKLIKQQGGTAKFWPCDVSSESQVKQAIEEIVEYYGRLDYAYNNAGIGGEFANVQNYLTADWDNVMAINLKGVFLCMKYQIPYILKQGKGAIVNCASLLSTVAYENDAAYVASKFGVLGLTKTAAVEYAKTGLRINAISPGFTRTSMIAHNSDDNLNKISEKHPIGRLALPEEIAEGVYWLCSDNASFAIGLNLMLDGGYTAI